MTDARFKAYPNYKDSGIEWLGRIPAHWDVLRLKSTVASSQNGIWGDEPQGDDNDIACIRVADFDRQSMLVREPHDGFTMRNVSGSQRTGRVLKQGDLLLEKSGGGEKQLVGAVVRYQFPEPAVCSNFVARVVPSDGHEARFLAYLHYSLYSARVNLRSIKQNTGIQNLDEKQYLSEAIALPDLNEQQAIANFLDRETARIDALVEKKERLIELLQEKRTALITHAVTKGLDPNVLMKDSGIEWLGQIPAHWEVWRIKHLAHVRRGASPRPIEDPIYFDDDGEYAWVRIGDLTASERYLEETTQRLSKLGQSKSVCLESGQLFVSIAATVGKPIITRIKCCIHDGFVHFDGLTTNVEFLWYLLQCGEAYKGLGKLGTQLNLNTETVGGICVPVPRAKEQGEIVDFLDRETGKIDALIAKIQEAIERLKEYRTALISAAVTGKIDVRGV